MPPRLKVYRTHLGFDDMIVAAPSQKAAIEAWSASPHLFSQGFAEVTTEPELVKAAMRHPGIVLRRQFGTSGGFSPQRGKLALPATPSAGSLPETPIRKPDRAASRRDQRSKQPKAQPPHEGAWRDMTEERALARQVRAQERQRIAAARAEEKRLREEAKAAAAEERQTIQAELESLTKQHRERLRDIDAREEALARERREAEQAFETRAVALRRQLEKL
jgi:colicin import membrane protein